MNFVIKKRYIGLGIGAGMVLLPIILLILPKTFFDKGLTLCFYTLVIGSNCIGCGMTRACMRLIHFDFSGAFQYNKLSFIVFPVLVFYYLRFFASNFRQIANSD